MADRRVRHAERVIQNNTLSTNNSVARLSQLAAGLSVVVAASFALAELTGVAEMTVGMPIASRWIAVIAGLTTAMLIMVSSRTRSVAPRVGIMVAIATGLTSSLSSVPHNILFTLVWVVSRISGVEAAFPLVPIWGSIIPNLINVAAAAIVAIWLLVDHRTRGDRCLRCGFARDATAPNYRRWPLRAFAVIAALGCLPYGVMKASWALGMTWGLTGHRFDHIGFGTPGFGDTVLLTGVSLLICGVMARPVLHRGIRLVTLLIGSIGGVMLMPVAVIGSIRLIPVLLGRAIIGDPEISDWAFVMIYGSFGIWGPALVLLTVTYAITTRRPCARHDQVPEPAPITPVSGMAAGSPGR